MRDFARKSLERPYTGPHKVLKRTSDRIFEIEVNGALRQVSVENIKPAHFLREDIGHAVLLAINDSTPILRTYSRKKKVTFNV